MTNGCEHINVIHEVTRASGRVCEECVKTGDRWVHLRTCQTCGVTLCCDSSPNRHASRHARAVSHPVDRVGRAGRTLALLLPGRSVRRSEATPRLPSRLTARPGPVTLRTTVGSLNSSRKPLHECRPVMQSAAPNVSRLTLSNRFTLVQPVGTRPALRPSGPAARVSMWLRTLVRVSAQAQSERRLPCLLRASHESARLAPFVAPRLHSNPSP